MLISPITNTSYNNKSILHGEKSKKIRGDINPDFTGLGNTLEQLSPLNSYMHRIFDRFTYISKLRKFAVDKELKSYLKTIELKTGKNVFQAWDINPNNSKRYIIFYHGLGQNITSNQELYKSIIKKGYGVFAPEYGGFGNSTGTVTAESIRQNTKSAIKYLNEKGIEKDNIGVVGFSLGSFPAITLAHKNEDLKFLVLISPFNSMKNETDFLLKGHTVKLPKTIKYLMVKFPFLMDIVDWSFQNARKIKNLKLPVYFIHSENDSVISTKSTKELAKHTKNLKEFVVLKTGGHSIDPEKIKAFNGLSGI